MSKPLPLERVVSREKPCNLNDRDAVLEAMHGLRRMAQSKLVMDDNIEAAWAMLMGAKALDRLAVY